MKIKEHLMNRYDCWTRRVAACCAGAMVVCGLCCLTAGCGKTAGSPDGKTAGSSERAGSRSTGGASEAPRSTVSAEELEPPVLEKQLAAYDATAQEYGGTVEMHLNFSGTSLTDDELAEIPLGPHTRSIDLSGTKVTDAGLAHLKKCTRLKTLSLVDLPITDAGLEHLRDFAELEQVNLKHTQVSIKAQLAFMKYLRQQAFRAAEK
jgi:hypothetical protein